MIHLGMIFAFAAGSVITAIFARGTLIFNCDERFVNRMSISLSVDLLDRNRMLPFFIAPLVLMTAIRLVMHWMVGDWFLVALTTLAVLAFCVPLLLYYLNEIHLAKRLFFAFFLIICTSSAVMLGEGYGIQSSIMVVAMLAPFLFDDFPAIIRALLVCLVAYVFAQVSFFFEWQIYGSDPTQVLRVGHFTEIFSFIFFLVLLYFHIRRTLLTRQAALQDAQVLKSENKVLRHLAYHLSHDFKQSLRNITQYSQLLSVKYADSGLRHSAIESDIRVIGENATWANGLIQEISVYLSVKSHEQLAAPVDLNEVLEAVRQSMECRIQAAGATFSIASPMPVVQGIRFEWVFLFQNLLENALKYCRNPRPMILVSALQQGQEHVILFQDNGGEIDPLWKEQVFEPFFRLRQHAEQEGSGMGLFICREIVQQMKGTIRMESDPGEGTRFFITVPA